MRFIYELWIGTILLKVLFSLYLLWAFIFNNIFSINIKFSLANKQFFGEKRAVAKF